MMPTKTPAGSNEVVRLEVLRLTPPFAIYPISEHRRAPTSTGTGPSREQGTQRTEDRKPGRAQRLPLLALCDYDA
jgi:hypothetical protein